MWCGAALEQHFAVQSSTGVVQSSIVVRSSIGVVLCSTA